LELASDPKSIALSQHKHIKLNGLYIYKGGDKVFSLQEMKDDGALLQHAPYFGNTEEMLVKLADLKEIPQRMEEAQACTHCRGCENTAASIPVPHVGARSGHSPGPMCFV
jgi:predicted aldo/keto reductase-like oxidoreductase